MSKENLGEKVVGVTGGSGYIASWIIKFLLQRGFIVKASVRNLNDPKETQHLVSLDGAKERLYLFEAELMKEGSFDPIVDGCFCVFHTASPVFFLSDDPQADLIEPALMGTLNVLRSCTKYCSTIKRVVYTSSTAAIMLSGKAMASGPEITVDETWFSDPIFCKESKGWYMLSKTLAEEAAWKFAKENGIDLITMNPGYVIGPMLQPTLNASVHMILRLINGSTKTYPNLAYRCVDVRDVAKAHIKALESQSANGRYCIVGHSLHYAHLLDSIAKLYPSLPIALKFKNSYPRCKDDGKPLEQGPKMSQGKAKSLGIEFTPLEVTLMDTIESLKVNGHLKIQLL